MTVSKRLPRYILTDRHRPPTFMGKSRKPRALTTTLLCLLPCELRRIYCRSWKYSCNIRSEFCVSLRDTVTYFQLEAYNKENTKILKKIHMITLGKLLPEICVLLRFGNYLRCTETILVSWVPGRFLGV